MIFYVYKHIDSDWEMSYPNNWEFVGEYESIDLADTKAVELCGGQPYETEPNGSELRRCFFGRKGKKSWDAMIQTKKIHKN